MLGEGLPHDRQFTASFSAPMRNGRRQAEKAVQLTLINGSQPIEVHLEVVRPFCANVHHKVPAVHHVT